MWLQQKIISNIGEAVSIPETISEVTQLYKISFYNSGREKLSEEESNKSKLLNAWVIAYDFMETVM